MEDQTRGMDPAKLKVRSAKGKTDRKNRLTIIIMGRFGKVRSFKVSSITLLVVFIFLLLYILGSLIVINDYIDLRREYRVQNETLERQGKDLTENRKRLIQSQEHEALLEDYIQDFQILQKESTGSTSVKRERQEKPQVVKEKPQIIKKEIPENAIDIRDMVIKKKGPLITVNLKLVNTDPEEKKIGGFVHILAVADSTSPPQIWAYPRQKMEDGLPMDFRRGELFIIKRFRPITGKIYLAPEGDTPSIVKVLVYDQSGKIMLEKRFEVKDES